MSSVFAFFVSQLLNWGITEFCISDHVIFARSKCNWSSVTLQSIKVVREVMFALFSFAVETCFWFKVILIVLFFQSFVALWYDFFRDSCSVFIYHLRIYLVTCPFPLERMFSKFLLSLCISGGKLKLKVSLISLKL